MAGKLQRLAGSLKAELAQHADMADLRRMQETLADTANELRQEMQYLRSSAAPDVPAWERLPPQRTPADFGLDEDGLPALRDAPTAPGFHTPSLGQRARATRRKLQPRVRVRPRLRVRKQAGGGR